MLKLLLNLFKSDIIVISHSRQVKNTVEFYSTGNENVRQKKYTTSNNIKQIQKEVFAYKFCIDGNR